MDAIHKQDGFSGQVQYVLPDPVRQRAARHLLVGGLHPTDIGWYPRARHHFRRRDQGAAQHILILCVRGEGWFEVRERRQRVEANQALLIRRGVAHVYGAAERAPWSIHWVHFLGDDAACFCNLLRADNPVVPVAADLMPRLRGLFREACAALSEGFTQEGIICAAQSVRHLLGLLFFGNSSFHPRTKAPRAEGIERTLEFLRERSEDRVTVAEMARRVDLSVTHFARQFRQHTGFAPMDYFIHLKMQRAARLLTLTPLTVKQVAARVGYDDPYYFSRLFRKIMGAPPTEYRVAKLGCHPSL